MKNLMKTVVAATIAATSFGTAVAADEVGVRDRHKYNTITIENGGHYALIVADNTGKWIRIHNNTSATIYWSENTRHIVARVECAGYGGNYYYADHNRNSHRYVAYHGTCFDGRTSESHRGDAPRNSTTGDLPPDLYEYQQPFQNPDPNNAWN